MDRGYFSDANISAGNQNVLMIQRAVDIFIQINAKSSCSVGSL